jgi:hypothetical protein
MPGSPPISASLSASGSSGASLSGATDASRGGNFGSTSFGAGSVVFGPASSPAISFGWPMVLLIVGLVMVAIYFLRRGK